MNETIITETLQDISLNSGDTDIVNFNVGNSNASLSEGSSGESLEPDSGAIYASPNVWTGSTNSSVPSVSTGDISTYSEVDAETLMEIQKNTSEMLESVSSIASFSVLIFMFLLFEWTEKKLKVAVNRFTDKRRS